MAIVWSFTRDKMEEATPRTVNNITPIEGGIMRRYDDVEDEIRYTFYILIRSGGQAGTYNALWEVRAANETDKQTGELTIAENVPANGTDLILLPPRTASGHANYHAIALGNVADPSDAVLQNQVAGWSAQIQAEFSPVVTPAVYNSEVNGSHAYVRQAPL